MEKGFDRELAILFENGDRRLPEEPFLSDAQRRIESIRLRRAFLRRLIPILGLIGIALASPWLIDGSILLSGGLEYVFAAAERMLGTRWVMLGAAILSIPVIVRYRWRIF